MAVAGGGPKPPKPSKPRGDAGKARKVKGDAGKKARASGDAGKKGNTEASRLRRLRASAGDKARKVRELPLRTYVRGKIELSDKAGKLSSKLGKGRDVAKRGYGKVRDVSKKGYGKYRDLKVRAYVKGKVELNDKVGKAVGAWKKTDAGKRRAALTELKRMKARVKERAKTTTGKPGEKRKLNSKLKRIEVGAERVKEQAKAIGQSGEKGRLKAWREKRFERKVEKKFDKVVAKVEKTRDPEKFKQEKVERREAKREARREARTERKVAKEAKEFAKMEQKSGAAEVKRKLEAELQSNFREIDKGSIDATVKGKMEKAEAAQGRVREVEAREKRAGERVGDAQKRVSDAEGRLRKAEGEAKTAWEDVNKARGELNTARAERDGLQKDAIKLEADARKMTIDAQKPGATEEHKKATADAWEKANAKKVDLQTANDKVADAQKNVNSLEAKAKEKDAEVKVARAELVKAQTDLKSAETAKTEATRDVEAAKDAASAAESDAEKARADGDELKKKIDAGEKVELDTFVDKDVMENAAKLKANLTQEYEKKIFTLDSQTRDLMFRAKWMKMMKMIAAIEMAAGITSRVANSIGRGFSNTLKITGATG